MRFEEFKNIVMAVKEAYPNSNSMTTEEGINLWYEMLKDLNYSKVSEAVYRHIQECRFAPSIAEVRNASIRKQYTSWTLEWMKLLNGSRVSELNEPGQYAFRLLTRDCFESCLRNPERLLQCMRTFESLYTGYNVLSAEEKEEFKAVTAMEAIPKIGCAEEVGDDW